MSPGGPCLTWPRSMSVLRACRKGGRREREGGDREERGKGKAKERRQVEKGGRSGGGHTGSGGVTCVFQQVSGRPATVPLHSFPLDHLFASAMFRVQPPPPAEPYRPWYPQFRALGQPDGQQGAAKSFHGLSSLLSVAAARAGPGLVGRQGAEAEG